MKTECTDEESEDLVPKCKNTGAGVASRCPLWNGENEPKNKRITDCSFYREVNENASLYAVFSGHQGPKVANMAMEGIAAEIMFGQLNDKHTDEEVHEVLRQAFVSVEKCYQASIDGLLAKYVVLQYQIDENIGIREDIVRSMEAIKKELAIGASAAICLIYNSRLFICNIGTCRVLLCRTDENQTSRVIQFSVDHNLLNEDELLRLSQLGVDVSQLRRFDMFNTRLIGYYLGKGGYKDCRDLATASAEPIISKPEIVGGITIDPSFQFLLLMSSGTCKYLHDIYAGDTTQENRQIVQMCAKELQSNTERNLTDVAQAVIDKIIQLRKDARDGDKRTNDDLTILLRNFNNKRNNHVVVQERRDDVVNIRNPKVAQKIPPYVDFSQYYENVKIARQKGTLPDGINFD